MQNTETTKGMIYLKTLHPSPWINPSLHPHSECDEYSLTSHISPQLDFSAVSLPTLLALWFKETHSLASWPPLQDARSLTVFRSLNQGCFSNGRKGPVRANRQGYEAEGENGPEQAALCLHSQRRGRWEESCSLYLTEKRQMCLETQG